MGLIKEPLNVDFFVDPKPLTKKEEEEISAYIREHKAKMAKRKFQPKKKTKDSRLASKV